MLSRLLVLVSFLMVGCVASAATVTITYSYDAAGRITRADYGNGKGFVYKWDAAGNLVARTPLPAATKRRAVSSAASTAGASSAQTVRK